MRAFSYFLVLILAAYLGKKFIGIASVYAWLFILGTFGTPPEIIATTVAYLSYIVSWVFVAVLLFRFYLCLTCRKLVIPDQYVGAYYVVTMITNALFCVAVIITLFSALGFIGDISGIPLGSVLLPVGLVSMVVVLRCEMPEIIKVLKS